MNYISYMTAKIFIFLFVYFLVIFNKHFFIFFLSILMIIISLELTRVSQDRIIFSKNVLTQILIHILIHILIRILIHILIYILINILINIPIHILIHILINNPNKIKMVENSLKHFRKYYNLCILYICIYIYIYI